MITALLMLALSVGGANEPPAQKTAKAGSPTSAKILVLSAIDAMGGEAKLRAIKSVRSEGISHDNMLEQSERPQGPWLVNYTDFIETRDNENGRLRRETRSRNFQTDGWNSLNSVVSGGVAAIENKGRFFPFFPGAAQEAEESIDLSPERALIAALDSADLRLETDSMIQDVSNHIVAFSLKGHPARLFLNADTALPTAVEIISDHPFDLFWHVWGDATTRIYFSLWTLEPGGIRYPRQWDVERARMPFKTITITKLALNVPIDEKAFAIPEDVGRAYEKNKTAIEDLPLGWRGRGKVQEIAADVVKIPAGWDVAIVRQKDGVVIIEAPIASGYSTKVLAEAERRYPGARIKAVVTTSDAWPHLGGIREYVARGIPVYALDLNRPILERVIAAPKKNNPDALQQSPRKAVFRVVSGKTVIGAGANRLELYPIRSESGERMMMAYFPEHKILYASDLIQKMPDGSFFMPQYLSEVAEAVGRNRLAVEKVFAMHAAITPWAEINAAIEKAKSSASAGQ
jgi:hypothetical protein